MDPEKIVIGIVLVGIGLLFFFNNKNIAKGAAKLYKVIYTEKNLKIMFKILGVFLAIMGIIIIFID